MPLYEYICKCGHKQIDIRPVDKRNDPIKCEKCESDMKLTISGSTFKFVGMKR